MQFIVLCSSNGTTFQAVIDAMKAGNLTAKCLGLITDKPNRGCLEKARSAGLSVRIAVKNLGESIDAYDARLVSAAHELENRVKADPSDTVIAAMGWMKLLSPTFLSAYPNRVLNVHPSLLPKYGGKGMYHMHVHEAVMKNAEKESGITIHVMEERYDEGKILLQKSFAISDADTPLSIKDHAQALEKEWYPKVLEMIERGEIRL